MVYKTEQEGFWAGEFGNEYINRNQGENLLASKICFLSKMLDKADNISSALEFGSNIGLNLAAIKILRPNIELSAIEINGNAAEELRKQKVKVYHQSILEFEPDYKRDLVLICGVLIHINPDELDLVYEKLYNSSKKYILTSDYYNPTPVSVNYRGHTNKLFKRDFAGELLDKYSDLKLIDYGFGYRRDNNYNFDDVNWFLLEKTK